jgi:hypothetical protein
MVESNAARDSPVLFRNFSGSFEDEHDDEDEDDRLRLCRVVINAG